MRHRYNIGMAGVQSVPRVMRGAPVARGSIVDVPLSKRDLAGLESQGIARTVGGLGSLGGCTLGGEIEMPAECARRGEIMYADGTCHPAQSSYPATVTPVISPTNTKLQLAPAAASARGAAAGMSKSTMLLAAIGGLGLVYYLTKGR